MENGTERYNFIRQKSGQTAKAFAESLVISKAMGCQISRDLLKPSRAALEKFFRVYHVNLHWFLTGKGPSGLENGVESLLFAVNDNTFIAVKIVDDRGIESLKIIPVGGK